MPGGDVAKGVVLLIFALLSPLGGLVGFFCVDAPQVELDVVAEDEVFVCLSFAFLPPFNFSAPLDCVGAPGFALEALADGIDPVSITVLSPSDSLLELGCLETPRVDLEEATDDFDLLSFTVSLWPLEGLIVLDCCAEAPTFFSSSRLTG